MSASVWQEQTGDLREAFECLVPLVRGRYVKVVVGDAIRLWGAKMLELADNLVDEVKATRKDVVRLRSHIAELERSLALDSTNSSKPPSSDGPGTKRKRTQSERTPTGRPSGGQPGHKATTLEQTPTPDRLVDHDPTACPGCGAPLSEADREGKPAVRQVFDLPEPSPLEVTEHRAHSCRCASCSTLTRGAFPQDVRGPVQYGPRITGFVSYLLVAQFVPEQRTEGRPFAGWSLVEEGPDARRAGAEAWQRLAFAPEDVRLGLASGRPPVLYCPARAGVILRRPRRTGTPSRPCGARRCGRSPRPPSSRTRSA